MKLAIITPGFLPVPAVRGGAIEQLIETLIENNEENKFYDIDLFTIYDEKINLNKYRNTKIIPIRPSVFDKYYTIVYNYFHKMIGRKDKFYFAYALTVSKTINVDDYDFILVENTMCICKRLKRTNNLYFHLHNDIIKDGQPEYQCRIVANKCKKIIAVSEYIKKRFSLITDLNKIDVLSNCIDMNKYNPENYNDIDKINLRSTFNINKNDYVFGFIGRICEEKGVIELISAFNKFSKEMGNAKLLLIGENKNVVGLREDFINQAKNNKNIIFSGYVNQDKIPLMLYSCDTIVIPSKVQESFCLVTLEAMAMKKSIIATKVGGITEQLDNECSILLESYDLENNLYNSMMQIYLNEDLRNNISKKAHLKVANNKKYDSNYYLSNLDRILKA